MMKMKLICCLLSGLLAFSAIPVLAGEENLVEEDVQEAENLVEEETDDIQDPENGLDDTAKAEADDIQDPANGLDDTAVEESDDLDAEEMINDGLKTELDAPEEVKGVNKEKAPAEKKETSPSPAELIISNGEKSIYGMIYRPAGESNGTIIIMSHGYNGSHNDWTGEGALFSANGYTAYAYDFCGGSANSKSSGATTEMTITSEKEDLLAVVDYFRSLGEFDKIFLLGGSQGGFISSLVAAELKDEIGALAMYFPALCIPDNWKDNYPDPAEAPDTFDFWGMDLGRGFVEDAQSIDVFGTIGNYKGNVLIIHGDEDAVVPFEYSEKAKETYENAELVKMEGEGHGWSEEAWPKAMEMVLEFFEKN